MKVEIHSGCTFQADGTNVPVAKQGDIRLSAGMHVKLYVKLLVKLLVAGIAILSFVGCAATRKVDAGIEQDLHDMVSVRYQQFVEQQSLPPHLGVLVHLQTPKGSFTTQAGFGGGEVSPDVHYRIASVSKTFTAAAVMLLDQEGKLDIDDYITETIPGKDIPYLPDNKDFAIPYKQDITIADLLSHRAGMFDVFNDPLPEDVDEPYAGMQYVGYMQAVEEKPNHQYTLEELVSLIAKHQLSYAEPGELYHYSDVGYMLLAGIVERVAAMSYDRFLQERFFDPMGLEHTSAPWNGNDTTLPEPFLTGYMRWDAEFFETSEDNMSCQVGPGNIISTPRDIATWIRDLLSGRGPLTSAQVAAMETIPEGNTTYALGVGTSNVGYGHSGAHPGYMNFTAYNKKHDVSVVVVAPFIDYDGGQMGRLYAMLELMTTISEHAMMIAGYDPR